jgi:hypothetical protein
MIVVGGSTWRGRFHMVSTAGASALRLGAVPLEARVQLAGVVQGGSYE